MILYILLEIILLILILVIIKVLYTRKENRLFSRVINVLLASWVLLLVIEYFVSNHAGLSWELDNFTLIGIYTYTQLVAVVLFAAYWFVIHVKRKWIVGMYFRTYLICLIDLKNVSYENSSKSSLLSMLLFLYWKENHVLSTWSKKAFSDGEGYNKCGWKPQVEIKRGISIRDDNALSHITYDC